MSQKTLQFEKPQPQQFVIQPAGTPVRDTADVLESLRTERERLVLEKEIAAINAETAVFKQTAASTALESLGEYVDPREWRDLFWNDDYGFPFSYTGQREGGKNAPFVESEQDLREIQSVSKYLATSNEYAAGVMDRLADFVIASGFDYTATTKEGAGQKLIDAVQDILDEFFDDNAWRGDLEREVFLRTRRDGEVFSRLYPQHGGRVKLRIVEPEYITEPNGTRELEGWLSQKYPHLTDWNQPFSWTFGVQTPESDIVDSVGYFVEWSAGGADWEFVPSHLMQHMKCNVDRNIKRGLSDFFCVKDMLQRASMLLRATAAGATAQAKIAYIREFEAGVTKSGVETMNSEKADLTRRRRTANGTKTENTTQMAEGTVLDIPQGRKYHPGPMGTPQGGSYLEVLQGALRAVGTRWSMPEFMISGDASNNSYASTAVAGSAFDRAISGSQGFYVSQFKKLLWKVIRIAYNAGRLARFNLQSFYQLKRIIELQIEPPQVETVDKAAETTRLQMLNQAGVLSTQTWAGKENLDFEQEQENGAAPVAPVVPGFESLAQNIDRAAIATNPVPNEEEKESGEYTKGKFRLHGLDICIETPVGAWRTGVGPDGTPWQNQMLAHYGYILRTVGADSDQVDCFIGPEPESEIVFVIDQIDQSGQFDEHKVMLGWTSEDSARGAYLSHYTDEWEVGPITAMTVPQFKQWLTAGDLSQALSDQITGPVTESAVMPGSFSNISSYNSNNEIKEDPKETAESFVDQVLTKVWESYP